MVKLKQDFEKHPDYDLGAELQAIKLAETPPKPGEVVLIGGWGLTGYNTPLSPEVRSLNLTVTKVEKFWLYTSTRDQNNRIVDPCKGDSGGPLVTWRNTGWELVGVLKGGGFDCTTNTTDDDGIWSNVANQHLWVSNQLVEARQAGKGQGKAEINLRPETGEFGGHVMEGNVYMGNQAVCDDNCGINEATVACLMLGSNLGIPEVKSHFGLADRGTRFWRSPLKCRGDEETLEDCEEGEKRDCALGEVAGVVCYFGDETQQTTTTVATSTKAASPVLQSMRARKPGFQAPRNLAGS